MSHEQQLLFALLAHQNDFVTQAELLAAFSKWLVNKGQPLPDLLVADGVLSADDKELLARLVSKHLEKFEGDASASLANLSGVSSIASELRFAAQQDSDALATVSFMHQAANRSDEATTLHGEQEPHGIRVQPAAGDRFRIVKEHAKGGLGVVFVAEDRHLKREVALKQIRRDRADVDLFRQRFLQEAEVTGQLEHPGIVPVYALGADASGRPYYAMRFIRGEDLQSRIRKFHEALNAKKHAFDGPELRELLRRFIDVCNAIDYAHDRGVLHRDLKPGNVMLGKHGETLVVDWGLAKPIGEKLGTDQDGSQLASEQPIPLNQSSDSATQQGVFLGTAVYAPPEQLKGELHMLCPASDVYSLGAILYELLCGKRLVEGKSLDEIIKYVESRKVLAPRSHMAVIPKPLDSICRTAIAPAIENRYQSASELRAEIEAWLNDTKVLAHRDSVIERTNRWARKNRSLVTTSSAVVLVGVIALIALTVVQGRANQQISEQRDRAKLLAANTLLDRGYRLASEGQITSGILHMGAALEELPAGESNLEEVIRGNISAWTANAQYSLGTTDIQGNASQILAVSDNGQYAATVVGGEMGYRDIVVLQCLPELKQLRRVKLNDGIGALAFVSDKKLTVSSGKALLEIDIQDGKSQELCSLPSIATALAIGSTGKIWLGCEQGELGYVERSEPKWSGLSVFEGTVIAIGVSQREDRIIACTRQENQGIIHVVDARGKQLSTPFVAGIGYSYAVDADHGYVIASAGSPANASIITFWRYDGTRLPASLVKSNSVNSIEIIPSRNEFAIAKKDLSVEVQSTFDWHYSQDQNTPLAAMTCRASRDSNVLVANSVGKSGAWVSATQLAAYTNPILQSSIDEPYCSIDLGGISLWGGNANQLDVFSSRAMKVVTSIPVAHAAAQMHRFEEKIVVAGENGLTLLDARHLTLEKTIRQPSRIARRGVLSSLESKTQYLISNVSQSTELSTISISDLASTASIDTDNWFCYGFGVAPKHDLLLLGLHDGTIRAFGDNKQEIRRTSLLTDAEIFDLAVDVDQTRVVAVTRLGTLFAYSLPNLEFLARVEARDGKYPTAKFSPDGNWLLTGFGQAQLRDSRSMLPIGPPRGCPRGPLGEKVDCFCGSGFATASQATSGIGYIEWTPFYRGWEFPKDQTYTLLSRRLGNSRALDGTRIKDDSQLTQQELDEWFPNPEIPLPNTLSFSNWQSLREKFGNWHFDPRNAQLIQGRNPSQTSLTTTVAVSNVAEGKPLMGVNGHRLVELHVSEPIQLGSPNAELGRLPNETYHSRSLKLKRLALGIHEVTVEQFSAFRPSYKNADTESLQLPACEVSWYDATAYCNWLSELAGLSRSEWCYIPDGQGEYGPQMRIASDWWRRKGYRLPTEFEWEYACRAGTLTARPFGDGLAEVDDWCWTSRNSNGRLHPVGQKQKNAFGIFDMLGNASEWCHTSHELIPTLSGEPSVLGEFPGPVSITKPRSVRGGSAFEFHGNARSAFRDYYTPDTKLPCVGFRVCRTIDY